MDCDRRVARRVRIGASGTHLRALRAAQQPAAPADTSHGEAIERRELGTAHPLLVQASAADGRWVVACQARQDTDGDGEVTIHSGHQGDMYGDALQLYVMFHDGEQMTAGGLADARPTGRYLALLRDGQLVVLDTRDRSALDVIS